jgi:hypothetical protein
LSAVWNKHEAVVNRLQEGNNDPTKEKQHREAYMKDHGKNTNTNFI